MIAVRRSFAWYATALLVALSAPTPVTAETQCTGQAERQALEDFARARQLAAEREIAEARSAYERSISRCPRVPAAFNLARVLEQLGDDLGARTLFRDLSDGTYGELDSGTRTVIIEALSAIEEQIATLEITASGADPVVLTIDGSQVAALHDGQPQSIEVNPGRHLIRGTAHDGRVVEIVRDVAGGSTHSVRLELPLTETLGRLIVTTDTDSDIEIIGVATGRAPLSRQLRADTYTVRLADDSASQSVDVLPGQTMRIQLDEGSLFGSPWFWILTGLVVAGGATAAVILATSGGTADPMSDPVWGRVMLLGTD